MFNIYADLPEEYGKCQEVSIFEEIAYGNIVWSRGGNKLLQARSIGTVHILHDTEEGGGEVSKLSHLNLWKWVDGCA